LPPLSAGRGTVALTFDDGPGIYTSTIIDILKKHNAQATFFVLGCRIPGNESIIKKIADAGFEIGNHTYDHSNLLKLSASEVKSQIERTQSLIYGITGTRPFYYRPPYGAFSKTLANSIDMAMVLWSVDPADWKYNSSDPIVSNILNNVRDGSVIILHDTQYITAITLDKILTGIKNKGYCIVSVGGMLKAHGIEPEKNMIYFSSYDIR
jgi:peptidoglycan-N-acetylglucosamine deacetylase